MDWAKGYSARYYATIVDSASWRDVRQFNITGGKINRVATDLRESADLESKEAMTESWIRVYLEAKQGNESSLVPLFTGIASTPEEEWEGYRPDRPLACFSVLQPAKEKHLIRGWYAPAEANGGTIIRNLLSVTPAPLVIEGRTPDIETSIVAEGDETHLSMMDKILTAIGWRLRIEGNGTIHLCEKAAEPIRKFSPSGNDVIEPVIKKSNDFFKCPNVFHAIDDDLYAVAKDENPDSPFSIPSRGREIEMTESSCTLNKDESIGQYAYRRLKEEQEYALTVNYDRRFDPELLIGDMVALDYSVQGVVGNYKILSQNITLGYAGTTSEEVCKV